LGEHDAALLAAGEGAERAVVVLADEAKAVEDFFYLVVDLVGVVVAEQLGEAVVAGGEALALRLVGRLWRGLGGAGPVGGGGDQLVQGAPGLLEEGAAGGELRHLAQEGGAGAGVAADLAGVGPVEPGEDLHQRRLADAVGADEADALAGEQLEADVREQGPL